MGRPKGCIFSEEHKENIRLSKLGTKHSTETKQKIGKASKGRCVGEKNYFYGVHYFGESHPRWKGGILNRNGYVWILRHEHPHCDRQGYILRSRLTMEDCLGRYLDPKESVHHINKIRDDDRIENLQLFMNINEHTKHHQNLRRGNSYA